MSLPAFIQNSGNMQADRRLDYARGLAQSGDLDAAIDLLKQTLEITPDWPVLPFILGQYCTASGRRAEAIDWFKTALRLDPCDHQGALLELEILGNAVIGDSMPPAFVETLFDQYAPRFDTHLIETLDYTAPSLIADMTARCMPTLVPQRILDLGCGTGLAGEYFVQTASCLEGVDLSGGMIEQARRKNIYHRLYQADLTEHLLSETEPFDLIMAADVLSYFGNLETVFSAVRNRLAPLGGFVFTVQKLIPTSEHAPDYNLDAQHRFSHSADYIARALRHAGLTMIAREDHILRKDGGENIIGLFYMCGTDAYKDCSAQVPPKKRLHNWRLLRVHQ